MWEFLLSTVTDLDVVTDFVKANQETVKQLLKEPPNVSTCVYVNYNVDFV